MIDGRASAAIQILAQDAMEMLGAPHEAAIHLIDAAITIVARSYDAPTARESMGIIGGYVLKQGAAVIDSLDWERTSDA